MSVSPSRALPKPSTSTRRRTVGTQQLSQMSLSGREVEKLHKVPIAEVSVNIGVEGQQQQRQRSQRHLEEQQQQQRHGSCCGGCWRPFLFVIFSPLLIVVAAVGAVPWTVFSWIRVLLTAGQSRLATRTAKSGMLLAFLLLLFALVYGGRTVLHACEYEFGCVVDEAVTSKMLALSKTAAKLLLSMFWLLCLVVTKPVTNFLEETKINRALGEFGWRYFHLVLSLSMVCFALIHAAGHVVRVQLGERELVDNYESFHLYTGLILFLIVTLMGIPYLVLKGAGSRWTAFKTLFRYSHHVSFYFFAFFLSLHAFHLLPVILVLWYHYSYSYSQLELRDVYVRVLQDGNFKTIDRAVDETRPNLVELAVELESVVPQSFGFYVTMSLRSGLLGTSILSNFTTIPVNERRFMCCVSQSTFSTALIRQLRHIGPGAHRRYTIQDDPLATFVEDAVLGTWTRINPQLLGLRAYGFFRSFDQSFGNKRNLICFVRGTGRVVSDAVLSYHFNFRTYDSILIVHESRQTYSSYSNVVQIDQSPSSRRALQEMDRLIRSGSCTRLSSGDADVARSVPLTFAPLTPAATTIVHYCLAARRVRRRQRRSGADAVRVLVCNVNGALTGSDILASLDRLLPPTAAVTVAGTDSNATEILVVNSRIQPLVENAFDQRAGDPRYHPDLLHIESFSIE